MKKLNLSKFDLGFMIAFAVVAFLGGGAWFYLSSELQDAQAAVNTANLAFKKYSANPKYHVVVSASNGKVLDANIELLKAQLEPLIQAKLLPKENKLHTIEKEDPVAWKHDLDDEVRRLKTAAKLHGVTLPHNFNFGFSRYQSLNPSDEQTAVLSRQLVGVEELATILINAPVKEIKAISRTYEEDPHTGSSSTSVPATELDHLGGYSLHAPGKAYTTYPFELSFETSPENFRNVLNNLIQSPYLFVVRTLTIQSDHPNSPLITDLDRMAGPPPPPMSDTAPGEVAATVSTMGPQYLFGNSTIKVKARIDMIEWNKHD